MPKHFRPQADTRIFYADIDAVPVDLGLKADFAAFGAVLGGIVQQVGKDLGQPGEVGVQPDRVLRQIDVQLVAELVDMRLGDLNRATQDLAQVDRVGLQLDIAAGDARHVHQVVDQADHLLDLAVHHLQRFVAHLGRQLVRTQDGHGIGNRRQRVA